MTIFVNSKNKCSQDKFTLEKKIFWNSSYVTIWYSLLLDALLKIHQSNKISQVHYVTEALAEFYYIELTL